MEMLSQRPKRALLRGNPGSGKRLCLELGECAIVQIYFVSV